MSLPVTTLPALGLGLSVPFPMEAAAGLMNNTLLAETAAGTTPEPETPTATDNFNIDVTTGYDKFGDNFKIGTLDYKIGHDFPVTKPHPAINEAKPKSSSDFHIKSPSDPLTENEEGRRPTNNMALGVAMVGLPEAHPGTEHTGSAYQWGAVGIEIYAYYALVGTMAKKMGKPFFKEINFSRIFGDINLTLLAGSPMYLMKSGGEDPVNLAFITGIGFLLGQGIRTAITTLFGGKSRSSIETVNKDTRPQSNKSVGYKDQ